MQLQYPIKVQAIRSKGRPVRLFIAVPLALAAAIALEPGEEVQWQLHSPEDLHLLRRRRPRPTPRQRNPR